MNVEFTGRQYEITPTIRKSVETGLTKIRKILGDKFDTKVILAIEKRRHKAEITISPRNGPLVGVAQAGDMKSAVNEALDHLEKQAVKYKTRWRSKKRHARTIKKWNGKEARRRACRPRSDSPKPPRFRWWYTSSRPSQSPPKYIWSAPRTPSPVRPMTLEEAIKEAHFRDRDVFVFRDPKGKVMVLHRTRDGKMELIEAP